MGFEVSRGFNCLATDDFIAGLCDLKGDGCVECACLAEAKDQARSAGGQGPPQRLVVATLLSFIERLACAACSRWLSLLLERLGTSIDAQVSEWGRFNWHASPEALVQGAGASKKRRTDFHVKQIVARDAVSNRQHQTAHMAAKSMPGISRQQASVWVEREMSSTLR